VSHEFVIVKRRSPWRHLGWLPLLLACVALGYWLGTRPAAPVADIRPLEERIAQLQQSLNDQQARASQAQRNLALERETSRGLTGDLKRLQDENFQLQKEVDLYRTALEPGQPALQIAGFETQPSAESGRFNYRLTLFQPHRGKKDLEGDVQVQLKGRINGADKVLDLADLAGKKAAERHFKMAYFEHFTGEFSLPEAFEPSTVTVTVQVKKGDKITKDFRWLMKE